MNKIKSDVRNSLDPSTVESLIRVSSEGTEIKDFNSKPYVEKWFQSKRKVKYRGWPNRIRWHDDDDNDDDVDDDNE